MAWHLPCGSFSVPQDPTSVDKTPAENTLSQPSLHLLEHLLTEGKSFWQGGGGSQHLHDNNPPENTHSCPSLHAPALSQPLSLGDPLGRLRTGIRAPWILTSCVLQRRSHSLVAPALESLGQLLNYKKMERGALASHDYT